MQGESGHFVYLEEDFDHRDTKQYEILSETGLVSAQGYVVINNIPVTEDGRPAFEERFLKRAGLVESEPGFQAIRILRPLKDDTYAIMTVWDNEESFKNWQTSNSYKNAHKNRGTSSALSTEVFPRPSFVTTYQL